MAGLVLPIHVFDLAPLSRRHARDKRGHDELAVLPLGISRLCIAL
jgi:hypothetical protein